LAIRQPGFIFADSLPAIIHPKLSVHIIDMRFDSAYLDKVFRSNFFIGFSGDDQLQDMQFFIGKVG